MWSILIPIVASIIGAFFGFIWQTQSDKRKDKKQILAILMMYRGLKAQQDDFVKAINVIDVYFHGNEKVIALRREYIRQLTRPLFDTGHHENVLLDLILAMAKDLGYKNIKTTDIMDVYYPERYNQNVVKPIVEEAKPK